MAGGSPRTAAGLFYCAAFVYRRFAPPSRR